MEYSQQWKGINYWQIQHDHSKKDQDESQKNSFRSQNSGYLCGEWYWQERYIEELLEVTEILCYLDLNDDHMTVYICRKVSEWST